MTKPTSQPAWMLLLNEAKAMKSKHMRTMFEQDPQRFERFSLRLNNLLVDYSKNLIDQGVMDALLQLAREQKLEKHIKAMFNAENINNTEKRPALHIALRNRDNKPILVDGKDVMPDVNRVLEHMRTFTEAIRSGKWLGFTGKRITDIVNIGIGGSDLGPEMACEALKPYKDDSLSVHFISNLDATQIKETLFPLNPETTLFVVVSKSFGTAETMTNAYASKKWFLGRMNNQELAIQQHFVAVSTNTQAVKAFGIDTKNMFEFWDWVGGRYSLWSAVGLSVALYIGMDHFEEMLAGAFEMDKHFESMPLDKNIPVIRALLGVWYNNFMGADTYAFLPYTHNMRYLPRYFQQGDMESNGKSVTRDGKYIDDYTTAPIIWGGSGNSGQHAFFQLLHQGTRIVPADFLAAIESHYHVTEHHEKLLSNFFAQTEALMRGKTAEEARREMQAKGYQEKDIKMLLPHMVFAGNKPSTSILFQKLSPFTLGKIIAMYEHKVFVQSIIWDINAFDQWGVQYGKDLASKILAELPNGNKIGEHDSSTYNLISEYKQNRKD